MSVVIAAKGHCDAASHGLAGTRSCHPPDVRVKAATRRLGVICSILLGRSFRNNSSKDMAFPHPQSRKGHYRKEGKPSCGGIVWKFSIRTINITEYRNAKDDVNPAKKRTLGGIADHLIPFHREFAAWIGRTTALTCRAVTQDFAETGLRHLRLFTVA